MIALRAAARPFKSALPPGRRWFAGPWRVLATLAMKNHITPRAPRLRVKNPLATDGMVTGSPVLLVASWLRAPIRCYRV